MSTSPVKLRIVMFLGESWGGFNIADGLYMPKGVIQVLTNYHSVGRESASMCMAAICHVTETHTVFLLSLFPSPLDHFPPNSKVIRAQYTWISPVIPCLSRQFRPGWPEKG